MNVFLLVLTLRLYLMSSLEPFLKVPHSLIDNEVLTSVEKCLYMLLTRLRTAKRGCVPSYAYLKQKLKIKDKRTILKALDRLQLFGYITWENRGNENLQHILNNNIRLRKIMSAKQKKIYNEKVRKKFVEKRGIKLVSS